MAAQQTTPAPARCTIHPTAMVCSESILETTAPYSITIGANTIIHPTASILAIGGDIVIGANNIIEERAVIINPPPLSSATSTAAASPALKIGDYNLIEIGSHIAARSIGDGNTFGCKSVVSHRYTIADRCCIAARVLLAAGTAPDECADSFAASAQTAPHAVGGAPPVITAPVLFQSITVDPKLKSTAPAAGTATTAAPNSKSDEKTAAAAATAVGGESDESVIRSGTIIYGGSHERRHRDVPLSRTIEELGARTDALRHILSQMHRLYVTVGSTATASAAATATAAASPAATQ